MAIIAEDASERKLERLLMELTREMPDDKCGQISTSVMPVTDKLLELIEDWKTDHTPGDVIAGLHAVAAYVSISTEHDLPEETKERLLEGNATVVMAEAAIESNEESLKKCIAADLRRN